eukprot:gene1664-33060_t
MNSARLLGSRAASSAAVLTTSRAGSSVQTLPPVPQSEHAPTVLFQNYSPAEVDAAVQQLGDIVAMRSNSNSSTLPSSMGFLDPPNVSIFSTSTFAKMAKVLVQWL